MRLSINLVSDGVGFPTPSGVIYLWFTTNLRNSISSLNQQFLRQFLVELTPGDVWAGARMHECRYKAFRNTRSNRIELIHNALAVNCMGDRLAYQFVIERRNGVVESNVEDIESVAWILSEVAVGFDGSYIIRTGVVNTIHITRLQFKQTLSRLL